MSAESSSKLNPSIISLKIGGSLIEIIVKLLVAITDRTPSSSSK